MDHHQRFFFKNNWTKLPVYNTPIPRINGLNTTQLSFPLIFNLQPLKIFIEYNIINKFL